MKDATAKTSAVQEYQITLQRNLVLADGTSSGKPLVLAGIYLQETHLGKLKTEDILVTEIVKKIEDSLKPVEGVRESTLDANKKFIALNKKSIDEALTKL